MKIVILTTATGQGHNSASGSVAAYLKTQGCEPIVTDVLKTGKKDASGPVSHIYDSLVTRAPWFFGMLYHAGELVSSSTRHSPIYYLNTAYAGAFYEKISALAPDVIVCTHIFSGQALTCLKEQGRITVPSVGIMTDYTCSPFWEETRLDRYVIPSRDLVREFASKGIPQDKIVPIGIPVSDRFRQKMPKEQARAMLELDARRVVVVMGGSMGYGEIPKIVRELRSRIPDTLIVTACGRNKKLLETLSGIEGVRPVPFTEDINILMDAADVLVTKPGGLSSTEAAVKRVPIVFSSPIPGGEEHNAAFFAAHGMAALAKTPAQAAAQAAALIADPERCRRMVAAQEQYLDTDADRHIGDLIMELAQGAASRKASAV